MTVYSKKTIPNNTPEKRIFKNPSIKKFNLISFLQKLREFEVTLYRATSSPFGLLSKLPVTSMCLDSWTHCTKMEMSWPGQGCVAVGDLFIN